MVTLYDVPAEALIDALASQLRDHIEEPDWASFTKSGIAREFAPEQSDFWYTRAASILRTIAINGPVGIDRLRTRYGGAKAGTNRYGVSPSHRTNGSGKLVRTIVQQLEDAGFVEQAPGDQGRMVSPDGHQLLDQTAGDVIAELDREELERYV